MRRHSNGFEITLVYQKQAYKRLQERKIMTIVNLTPHPLSVYTLDGSTLLHTIPSTGMARASETRVTCGEVEGVPLTSVQYGETTGLPDPVPGTIYVVSTITANASPRADVYVPGEMVRDKEGRIVGSKGLTPSLPPSLK
jgi:hypothetical protein